MPVRWLSQHRSSRRRMALISALGALALAGGSSKATSGGQEEPEGISVLFVGNSLTIVNDLPSMLEALLRSTGWKTARVASLSQPGFGLEDHWRGGVARAAIRQGGWDVVVLQQGPSATEGRPSLLEYSKRFAEEARDAGATVGLYMVWPEKGRRFDFDGVSRLLRDSRQLGRWAAISRRGRVARGLVPRCGSRPVRRGRLPSEPGSFLPGGDRHLRPADERRPQRIALPPGTGFGLRAPPDAR